MAVRIIEDATDGWAVLYCSTTMWAFGPVFYSADEAREFLDWLQTDPRALSDKALEAKYDEYRATLLPEVE